MSSRSILILCLLLAASGWIGLAFFTYHHPPDALNRLLALALLWPTLFTTLLPLAYSIRARRRARGSLVAPAARQSGLTALLAILLLWLQFVHALTWVSAVLLVALFMLAEVLLAKGK